MGIEPRDGRTGAGFCALEANIFDLDVYGNAVIQGLRNRALPVFPLQQGDAVVFAVHHRPVRAVRGVYRVNVRHGFRRLRAGERYALGVIFHDANWPGDHVRGPVTIAVLNHRVWHIADIGCSTAQRCNDRSRPKAGAR